MKVCFPVAKAEGLESEVYGHFGSAPEFMVVDTDDNNIATIKNGDQDHEHGMCNPVKALNNQHIDALVVAGIGAGALSKLNQQGITVFQAQAKTVKDNIRMLQDKNLPEFMPQHTCAGHSHGISCGH
jgi:predicted Fe-Mo cluster-binding NifX family protein